MNKAQPGTTASSRGRFFNTGNGPALQLLDIGHSEYVAVVEPNTAFWSLVKREKLADVLTDGRLLRAYRKKAAKFADEMQTLRFGLKPSAVYFNPTERCNLNCTYCYIPEKMRSSGRHMSTKRLFEALDRLHDYFKRTVPRGLLPQIVFHGAEPLLNRDAVFAGIERYGEHFRFGVQTNGTLLDDEAIEFLSSRQLYQETGRKLPVANFANILLAIVAPAARRLMCDISPCGGGRCFFALAPNGDMFPCSEFIGLKEFKGGNLFKNDVEDVLQTPAFRLVTERKVEDIDPCNRCAIRHFCGSPCPAEAHEMNGGMEQTGAFCEFYEEQVRYAFRLIADGKEEAYLWDAWDEELKHTFDV